MNTVVVYSTVTGNTRKVAEAIYENLAEDKNIINVENKINLDNYDLIIVGYWVDRGLCDSKTMEFLESIMNKNIILFGTLGAEDKGEYYSLVKSKVEALVDDSNKVKGHFLCRGKMTDRVLKKYEEMLSQNPDDERIKYKIKSYESALSHPDEIDLKNAVDFVKNII